MWKIQSVVSVYWASARSARGPPFPGHPDVSEDAVGMSLSAEKRIPQRRRELGSSSPEPCARAAFQHRVCPRSPAHGVHCPGPALGSWCPQLRRDLGLGRGIFLAARLAVSHSHPFHLYLVFPLSGAFPKLPDNSCARGRAQMLQVRNQRTTGTGDWPGPSGPQGRAGCEVGPWARPGCLATVSPLGLP